MREDLRMLLHSQGAVDGWSYERDAMAAWLKDKAHLYTLLTLSTPYTLPTPYFPHLTHPIYTPLSTPFSRYLHPTFTLLSTPQTLNPQSLTLPSTLIPQPSALTFLRCSCS